MIGKIVSFPRFQNQEEAGPDGFLTLCRHKKVDTIDILVESHGIDNKKRFEREQIVVVPTFMSYEGRQGQEILVASKRKRLADLRYSRSDSGFQHPLHGLIDLGDPWGRLREHGRLCAQYCAQRGFEAELFTSFHPYHRQRKLVYIIKAEEAALLPPVKIPWLIVT